jgi:hypothetical protein
VKRTIGEVEYMDIKPYTLRRRLSLGARDEVPQRVPAGWAGP